MAQVQNAFAWSDDLGTGVRAVDLQHRKFFKLVNAVMADASPGGSPELVGKAFKFLRVYIAEHFGMEEELMAEYRYPGTDGHRSSHAHYRAELKTLAERIRVEGCIPETVRKLKYFLVEWYVDHIKSVDKKLCAFLRAEALKNRSIFSRLAALTRSIVRGGQAPRRPE